MSTRVLEGPRDSRGPQGEGKHGARTEPRQQTGPSVRHVCAHRKCVAVRDRARAMSARVPKCTAMGAVCLCRRHGVGARLGP